MTLALFDTNILIDFLNGIQAAKRELAKHRNKAISAITWMEVMVGAQPETESIVRDFLNDFSCLPVLAEVCELAVILRKQHNIKLPDAIVWATAQHNRCVLITRNTKDFKKGTIGIHVPYQL